MNKNKKHIILYIVLIAILFVGLYFIGNYNMKYQNAVEDKNRFEFNYRYQYEEQEYNFSIKKDDNKFYYLYEIKNEDNITSNTYVVNATVKNEILDLAQKYNYLEWPKLKDKDASDYDVKLELITDGYCYKVNNRQDINQDLFIEANQLLESYIKE